MAIVTMSSRSLQCHGMHCNGIISPILQWPEESGISVPRVFNAEPPAQSLTLDPPEISQGDSRQTLPAEQVLPPR